MKKEFLCLVVLLNLIFTNYVFAESGPDLETLSKSGYMIGPGNDEFPIHRSWKKLSTIMEQVDIWDFTVSRMESILCSEDQNRSVLVVGEPTDAWKYVFARLAVRPDNIDCMGMWHVEIDISQIEAGNSYVGQVDEYWKKNVLEPADGKQVVLYFRNLGSLIGIGSHSQDSTGIESELATNLTAGRFRAVAFVDKYEYQSIKASENAYILNSFTEKVQLEDLTRNQTKKLVNTMMDVLYPRITLHNDQLKYLLKTLEYYQPNVGEPKRTVTVLNSIIRQVEKNNTEIKIWEPDPSFESRHPYESNTNEKIEIEFPDVDVFSLIFEKVDFYSNDKIVIYDTQIKEEDNAKEPDGDDDTGGAGEPSGVDDTSTSDDSGNGDDTGGTDDLIETDEMVLTDDMIIDNITGTHENYRTKYYSTNHITLHFTSNSYLNGYGFKISKIVGKVFHEHVISMEEIRTAIFDYIQIPRWILDRDYSLIQKLEDNLDDEVIGISDGRKAAVREAKIGYVVGRTTKKPIASMLLVGPTGTGKSHLGKALADNLNMRLVTVDMTAYQTQASFERFVSIMTNNLTLYPYAVYLFEEIDKASHEILDRMYFMLDDGIFYNRFQRPLFARGAFIVMTTNAAYQVILDNKNKPDLKSLVNRELQQLFRPSFLNRFNAISISTPFTKREYRKISKVLVKKKVKKVRDRYGWNLQVDNRTVKFIAKHGRSVVYGQRPMERLMENIIMGGIAEFQLMVGEIYKGTDIFISLEDKGDRAFKIENEGKFLIYYPDMDNNNGR